MMSATTIQINGETVTLPDSGALTDVLRAHGIDPASARGVAVAVNERIVRRSDWVDKILTSGDEIEIVTARQGG
jgi:sulfur carrier protein